MVAQVSTPGQRCWLQVLITQPVRWIPWSTLRPRTRVRVTSLDFIRLPDKTVPRWCQKPDCERGRVTRPRSCSFVLPSLTVGLLTRSNSLTNNGVNYEISESSF